MTRKSATFIGFLAVLLWALLALFTVASNPVPALQLNAVSFAIGGVIGLFWIAKNNAWHELRGVSPLVYAFGTVGIFGYHFLYFSSLRLAPPAEAGLINYLWPLLIVLFSGLLPGERLRPLHILGAVLALVGALLVVARGTSFTGEAALGYLLALGAAFTWASYSVISRRIGHVTTASVTVFCLLAAALSFVTHLAFEQTAWPDSMSGWGAIIALGLGPAGGAFYLWDMGMKKGDIQLLGTASYAAPLLSTLALILAGMTEPRLTLLLSAGLIMLGAGLAAYQSRQTG
ncbi:aromatic amino acid exporter YddG [Celeribacter sp. SCSIO 80788]|uniref:aromatic amino acid exporter YddG n=1 Tax=Celeribacter sp. SCSIO 80788 TaxID=3117013 RepID=UPI003DA5ECB5